MITEETKKEKMCLFCASDYHLEMILLPYMKDRLQSSKFIIFTKNNLEESLQLLLTKVNLNKEDKEKIKKINWKNEDKIQDLKKCLNNKDSINIIINGDLNYIKTINDEIKDLVNEKVNVIDCFHVGDLDIDIEEKSKEYKYILNTQKI